MSNSRNEYRRMRRELQKAVVALAADTPSPVDAELLRCVHDFGTYSREYLRQCPTSAQLRIADLAEKPPYRVLVPSANNQGKTWLAGAFARYKYQKHTPSQVLITATTKKQIRDGVFKELRSGMPLLPGLFPRDTRAELSADHFIDGFTAENPDAFQGRHGRYLTIIFDEATGIARPFWERAGTMFGGHEGHAWLCFYNPNDASSVPFGEEESASWHLVRLSALEHPNIYAELAGLPAPIPGAIRLGRVLDRIAAECEPLFRTPASEQELQLCFEFPAQSGLWWRPKTQAFEAQVLGRWPLLPTEAILSPAQIEACSIQAFECSPEWGLAVGCDIARFGGDKTAIAVRRGRCLLHVETHQSRDSVFVIQRLRELLYQYAITDAERRCAPIYIDDTGGYGGGVVDHMDGANVVPLHMSSRSPAPLRTVNMRSYLWFNLAELIIASHIDLSRLDPATRGVLKQELSSPRYRFDEAGRRRLEPKIHVRERLGRSPDIADAVALAFYLPA